MNLYSLFRYLPANPVNPVEANKPNANLILGYDCGSGFYPGKESTQTCTGTPAPQDV